MKDIKDNPILYKTERSIKIIACFILSIFVLHLYIIPSAYSVTLEEQARKSTKNKPAFTDDDFTRKARSRRDLNVPERKDPRLACLLSLIIPGSGHIYLKDDIKGIAFFTLSVVGYAFAGYYAYAAYADNASGTEKKSNYIISALLLLVSVILHVVGIVEAYNDAIEINEKYFYYGTKKSASPYIAKLTIEKLE